jgi:hypothetical protein
MEDIIQAETDDYEHRIVSIESADCECGSSHDEGDALWGGVVAPDTIDGRDPYETVASLHSVEVEYRQS